MNERLKQHEEATRPLQEKQSRVLAQGDLPLQERKGAWRLVIALLVIAAVGSVWLALSSSAAPTRQVVVRDMEREYHALFLGCITTQGTFDPGFTSGFNCWQLTQYFVQNVPDPYQEFSDEFWHAWWSANRPGAQPRSAPLPVPQSPDSSEGA